MYWKRYFIDTLEDYIVIIVSIEACTSFAFASGRCIMAASLVIAASFRVMTAAGLVVVSIIIG